MDSPVRDRLEEFIDYERLNRSEFCRIIGVSVSFVSSIRSSIQPERLVVIMKKFPQLNIVWLLTGVGKMQNSPKSDPNLMSLVEAKDKIIANLEETVSLQKELLNNLREKVALLEEQQACDAPKKGMSKSANHAAIR